MCYAVDFSQFWCSVDHFFPIMARGLFPRLLEKGLLSAHQWNTIQMAFPWWYDSGPLLYANCIWVASFQITEMNKRWQEYSQQRDTVLSQLQKELADYKDKEKLNDAKTANLERTMQEQLHRILEDSQRNVLRETQEKDQVKQPDFIGQVKQTFWSVKL